MIRLTLIAALMIAGVSEAQRPMIMFPADASCADWHAERRGQGQYPWQSEVSWFQGFVSGHNAYAKSPETRAILADPFDVELWLDTYCQKNPSQHLVHGAIEYIEAHGGSNPLPAPQGK